MIYQLRIYEIFDRNKGAFHERFRDHAARIMKKYGFDITSMWEGSTEGKIEFVYVLRWRDEATMKAAWDRFMADPEWAEIKSKTLAESGEMVGKIEDRLLKPLDYSPAQWT